MMEPADGSGLPAARVRLPAATRPGAVRLQIADLTRSLDYYRRILGLRVLASGRERATLAAQDGGPALLELRERPGAAPVPPGGRLGLFHYALLLPERAALGRFARHLARLGVRPGAADHLVSEALYLHDPDGLGIEVYADRPRSAWRWDGPQVVMTTDPLDTAGLIRTGGSGTWEGMPAGTAIGHVHLRVGDLARANAFYHEGLGLDRTVWSYPGALFFSAGGYHHHVGVNTWSPGAPLARENDARLLEWELVLPSAEDARGAVDALAAAGHAVERTPDGAVASDAWGTAVRLHAG